jgi:hypothetical protein
MRADLEERIIPPSRGTGIEYLVLGVPLVGVGVWIMIQESFWYGLVATVFFTSFVVLGALMLIGVRPCLRLKTTGLDVCTWFRKGQFKWSDVERIEVGRVKAWKAVFIHLSQDTGQLGLIGRAANKVGMPECTILDMYRLGSAELADLMNEYVRTTKQTSGLRQVIERNEPNASQ